MPNNPKQTRLTDMIDIEFLQKFQDIFAKSMGVASITVDENGPITAPSNFTDFCIKHTRESAEGYNRCNQCDIRMGKIAAEKREPVIYTCHSGLTDFAVPIVVAGEHIASILGGQVLTKEPDENHFRALAKELGINEDEYISAVRKIKIVPIERVEAAAQLLFIVANAMSKIANKTLNLVEQAEREKLQQSVIETIRSTLDIDEIKKNVVQGVGKMLEAYRCFIIAYDTEKNCFNPLDENSIYLSGPDVVDMVGFNPEDEGLVDEFKNLKELVILDVDASVKKKKLENPDLELICERYKVKTAIRIPITYANQLFGLLVIQYDVVKSDFDNETLEFIKSLASQVGIAIYQSWLYKKEKKSAERELLLRKIIENIRGSLNLQETLFYICKATTKLFNVQRAAITEARALEEQDNLILRKEYKVDTELLGITDIKNFPQIAAFWSNKLLKGREVFAIDDIENSDTPSYFKDTYVQMGVKSIMGTAIGKGQETWGTLVLSEYNERRNWSDDEKALLKSIADQVYIAINQAVLFEKQKKAAEREALLRNITDAVRSTLDIETVKKRIVDVVGKTLHADRCFISEYDSRDNTFEIIKDEYVSSPDIVAYMGSNPNEDVPIFMEAFKEGKTLLIQDKEIFIDSKVQQFEKEELAIQKNNVNACFAVPLFHNKVFLGFLATHFVRKHHINEEEIQLMNTIANQVAIALHQANIYKLTKLQAQKERLYRTITEKIRSTLDIEELFELICSELASIYNIQRSFIVKFKSQEDRENEVQIFKEFKSSPEIKGLQDDNFDVRTIEYWGKVLLKEGKKIVIDNIPESDTPDYFKETYKSIGAKSIMGIAIKKDNDDWGWVGVSEYNYYRHWSEDDVKLLETISDQIYIAIKQAELYNITKANAERERLIGTVLSKAISTFDINQIKQIVNEIGILTKADRCYFVEVDLEGRQGKPLYYEGEFLASADIKSIMGYQFPTEEVQKFVDMFSEAKDLIVFDYEELRKNRDPNYIGINTYSNLFDLKSGIGIPFVYMDKLRAVLCIEYSKEKVLPTADELDFLRILGNQIGMTFNQIHSYEDIKKTAEREHLLRKIFETMRMSLDINDIKQTIVTEVGKALEADRCFIVEYDNKRDKFLLVNDEYLSSDKIISYKGTDINIDVPSFSKVAKSGKALLVNNGEIKYQEGEFGLQKGELDFDPERETLEKYQVNSLYNIPLFYHNEFLGALSISYTRQHIINDEEIALINIVANQIAIALHQATLYKVTQIQVEKEKLIADILSKAISTFDIKQMKPIVSEIGQLAKADRCYFVEVDLKGMQGFPIDNDAEYLASPDIKTAVGYPFRAKDVKRFVEIFLEERDLVVFDFEEMRKNTSEEYQGMNRYSSLFDLKSGIEIPFYFLGNLTGVLCIEYVKEKVIPTDEERDFLRILANQIGITFNQIQNYQDLKKTAERETILRNIIEKMRSSLDVDAIKREMVVQIGIALNADRVAFADYDPVSEKYLTFEGNEYRSNPESKSFIGYDFWATPGFNDFIRSQHIAGKDIIFSDLDEFLAKNNLIGTGVEDFYRVMGFKSSLAINILHGETFYGNLVVTFEQKREISEDDIEFIKTLANQSGTAVYQSDLYKKQKKTADREHLLRTIISTIRQTLDINEIKKNLVIRLSKYMNAERGFFAEYDSETRTFLPVDKDSEYLVSSDIESMIGFDWNSPLALSFLEILKEKKEFNIADVDTYIIENNYVGTDLDVLFRQHCNLKSVFNVLITYGDSILGFFCMDYFKNKYPFTKEDEEFIKTVVDQVGIGLYQAKLYRQTQIQAQREKISRNLIEILRNTLDKSTIKQLFVKNIGQYFHADRVFFSEYDSVSNMYLPVDKNSEYLSSTGERSFVGYDWSQPENSEYIQPLLDRKELNIFDWSKYISQNPKGQDFIALFENSNVKSSYNLPVLYQQSIIGYFCIEFTQRVFKMPDEDINLVRSICRQAGIALYHAELYERAQEASRTKDQVVRNIALEIRTKLNEIVKIPETLSKPEITCEKQSDYLEILNKGIQQILERLDNII